LQRGRVLNILRAIEPKLFSRKFPHRTLIPTTSKEPNGPGNPGNNKVCEFKLFQQVQVDRYDMPQIFLPKPRESFACVEQTSQEYLELMEENNNSVRLYGFQYPNSCCLRNNDGKNV